MLLARMALPPIQFGSIGIGIVVIHVLVLTFLMNIGKCVPLAAYGDEATLRKRVALSLGMFPRGEVGIGVLLVSLEIFHQTGSLDVPGISESISLGGLSLALNLCLTGLFILALIQLLNSDTAKTDKAPVSFGRESDKQLR